MATITGINRLDSLLAGATNRWNASSKVGTATNVTFSFAAALPTYADAEDAENKGFSSFNQEQKVAVRAIFARLGSEFGITFTEVTDSAANYGSIRLYNNGQGETSAGAALYPNATSDDNSGDVFINNAIPENLTDIKPGTSAWATLVHEIGHAIGLKHPGNYNAGDNSENAGDPPFLPTSEDNTWNTIMSYTEAPAGQQRDWFGVADLEALGYLYGKKALATGDSTYSYTNAAGLLLTVIQDSGGVDVIDLSKLTTGAELDMRPGALSSVGLFESALAKNTLSIAYDSIIENAIGSVGNDTIIGNDVNNLLRGGKGNDKLTGGAGVDMAVFAGAKSTYQITTADGMSVKGGDGNDTLVGIERLQFDDVKVAFDLDSSAGQVAKLLGVIFGTAALTNKTYVGLGLGYADKGMSYTDLATLALGAVGVKTSTAIVNLLWTNLFGSAPTAPQAAPYITMLDSHQQTPGSLSVLAADLALNLTHINLVGLQASGIDYV